jgi:hypothetical protein
MTTRRAYTRRADSDRKKPCPPGKRAAIEDAIEKLLYSPGGTELISLVLASPVTENRQQKKNPVANTRQGLGR